jgi:hypothetical protein
MFPGQLVERKALRAAVHSPFRDSAAKGRAQNCSTLLESAGTCHPPTQLASTGWRAVSSASQCSGLQSSKKQAQRELANASLSES